MEYTSNFNLKKPAQEDKYNVADFNENMDTIDKSLGDPLPIGSVIEYAGTEVPQGWEVVTENDYSTTEVKTGQKWINGKPVYKKVISYLNTIPANTEIKIPVGVNDIEQVIKIEGCSRFGETTTVPLNFYNIGDGYGSYIFYDNAQKGLKFRTKWSTVGAIYAIIEYTKTTDKIGV